MTNDPSLPAYGQDTLEIIELDDRLEFSIAVLDSDLDTDSNSTCNNVSACSGINTLSCQGSNSSCQNGSGCT